MPVVMMQGASGRSFSLLPGVRYAPAAQRVAGGSTSERRRQQMG